MILRNVDRLDLSVRRWGGHHHKVAQICIFELTRYRDQSGSLMAWITFQSQSLYHAIPVARASITIISGLSQCRLWSLQASKFYKWNYFCKKTYRTHRHKDACDLFFFYKSCYRLYSSLIFVMKCRSTKFLDKRGRFVSLIPIGYIGGSIPGVSKLLRLTIATWCSMSYETKLLRGRTNR